jgi:hypothetical protein
MNKLKLWDSHESWDDAERCWDEKAQIAEKDKPITKLKVLPQMPGITSDTSKLLKWKALKWMVSYDHEWKIFLHFLKHPLKYSWRLLKSYFKGKSYKRDDDFFLYGIDQAEDLTDKLKNVNSTLVVGFSYCHKPFECPSKRFTSDCIHDLDNPVCQQCFIGKVMHALPKERTLPLIIPTIHYIGDQIFKTVHANPDKEVLFLITACELTLEMFGDWGNMAGIKGIGVRLDGRICNTMKAFELSEQGVKPGLTVVLESTQDRILNIVKDYRREIVG